MTDPQPDRDQLAYRRQLIRDRLEAIRAGLIAAEAAQLNAYRALDEAMVQTRQLRRTITALRRMVSA